MTPEIYHRVTEARPELKAANVEWAEHTLWTLCGECSYADICIPLIVDHWTEMLPEGFCIAHNKKGDWLVGKDMSDDYITHNGPTRFHALAEFHVPGSTKGAE